MLNQDKFNNILDAFIENNIPITQFICDLLNHSHLFAYARAIVIEDLLANTANVMIALLSHDRNVMLKDSLIHHYACNMYKKEIKQLTGSQSTLQFNAKHAQAYQVDRFNADALMKTISDAAPRLWDLLFRLISADGITEGAAADKQKLKHMHINVMFLVSRMVQANNKRCNFLGAIVGIFLHTCNTPERVIDVLARSSSSISASAINDAINSLSASAALDLKNAGKTFMYSYVLDNFDVQLKHKETTVEQSQDTLFHLTSASLIRIEHASLEDLKHSDFLWQRSRINDARTVTPPKLTVHELFKLYNDSEDSYGMCRRERFNAWKFMLDLCTYGPPFFRPYLKLLQDPESVEKIPVAKTVQIPARSMHNSNATINGNIKSALDVLTQSGVDDPGDYVIPFHGDLGTYERFRSAQIGRSIEDTPLLRMQYVVFIPGLFHTEMSCANALYKMFLEKKTGHADETSFYNKIEVLYPQNSGRIANNKGSFQMISGCIQKTGITDRLECWRTYISTNIPDCPTLNDFAQKEPSFEALLFASREIAKAYSSSSTKADAVRRKAFKERDEQYENTLKRIDFFLLYEETQYSMRHGDIGRLETCLITWLPIFKGTGKHKYAAMLTEFLLDVHFIYPPSLRKLVRYNWLCNLKGTEDGFRGVDWLLELNNLLTKVIYGGKGSNYTVDRIIKESGLIQLYRNCKHVIEEQLLLSPKTMEHGRPDFTLTFELLSQMAIDSSLLREIPGRQSGYHIPDVLDKGMEKYNKEARGIDDQDGELADPEDPGDSIYEVMPSVDMLYD